LEQPRREGTPDKDYNLIWFVEKCLDNALRLETYIADAERDGDMELADLFAARGPRAAWARRRARNSFTGDCPAELRQLTGAGLRARAAARRSPAATGP
jgi:hypothetical protein